MPDLTGSYLSYLKRMAVEVAERVVDKEDKEEKEKLQ